MCIRDSYKSQIISNRGRTCTIYDPQNVNFYWILWRTCKKRSNRVTLYLVNYLRFLIRFRFLFPIFLHPCTKGHSPLICYLFAFWTIRSVFDLKCGKKKKSSVEYETKENLVRKLLNFVTELFFQAFLVSSQYFWQPASCQNNIRYFESLEILLIGKELNKKCRVSNTDIRRCSSFMRAFLRTLSLIHIWRCRRSTLCRSRWSPYH